jgi:ribosomal protein S14
MEAAERIQEKEAPARCKSCLSVNLDTRPKGPHIESFCVDCGRHQKFLSKAAAGIEKRTVQSTHAAIRPKDRARIIERATGRCELCGRRDVILNVSHFLSVAEGHKAGLTDEEINCDENLSCMCEECNLGIGRKPFPLRLAVAIIRARNTKDE